MPEIKSNKKRQVPLRCKTDDSTRLMINQYRKYVSPILLPAYP